MWEPSPDPEAAAALGERLRAIGYDEEAVEDRLGEDGLAAEAGDALVYALRLEDDELGDAIRLLLLARPVSRSSFAGASELVQLGLATDEGSLLVPRARIVPHGGRLPGVRHVLATATTTRRAGCASFTPTAYWLASLTPRRRVARALDIGTGNGVHALLAARHADEVVATDMNPRALAFTQISAALNGHGQHRDAARQPLRAGRGRDVRADHLQRAVRDLARRRAGSTATRATPATSSRALVVTSAAAHLEDDGFASVLVSWLAASEDEPDEHVHEWLDGNGCDAWILALCRLRPGRPRGWVERPPRLRPGLRMRRRSTSGRRTSPPRRRLDLRGRRRAARRAGDRHIVRADSVDEDELEFASDQIERVFTALEAIARDGDAVLDGTAPARRRDAVRPGARPHRRRHLDAARPRRGYVPGLGAHRRRGRRARRARRRDDARPGGRARRAARRAVEAARLPSCAATCATSRASCSRSARWSSHDDVRSVRRASGRRVVRDAVPSVRRRAQLLGPGRDRALLRGQRAASCAASPSRATAACSSSTAAARSACALLGDNIAELAVANGWAGIVINGCVRDVVGSGRAADRDQGARDEPAPEREGRRRRGRRPRDVRRRRVRARARCFTPTTTA